jgi:hypothetical protein
MTSSNKITLYRPVEIDELALIFDSGMRAIPLNRLDTRVFFVAMTDFSLASQLARDLSNTSELKAGYVVSFTVDGDYASRFEFKLDGEQEPDFRVLWVPPKEQAAFNGHIEGRIEVDAAYFGDGFTGLVAEQHGLCSADAIEQFVCLREILDRSLQDFFGETSAQRRIVYCHAPFWRTHDFTGQGVTIEKRDALISDLVECWFSSTVEFPLPRLKYQNPELGNWAAPRNRTT